MGLVLQGQRQGEAVAWVSDTGSSFYPPDAEEMGIDLDALVVLRLEGARHMARGAEVVLRSGAFALVVVDFAAFRPSPQVAPALLGRMGSLGQKHGAAILFLTQKEAHQPSLSSLISLRAEGKRRRLGEDRYVLDLSVLKDKCRGPGWKHQEERRGAVGLR